MIESEKLLEKNIVSGCKKAGGWAIKLLSNHLTGLPDRMCLFPKSKICFVELKTTNRKPSKIQLAIHRRLRSLGFEVRVIDTTEGLKKLIQDYGSI